MKAGMTLAVFLVVAVPAAFAENPRQDPSALARQIDLRVDEKLKVQQLSRAPRSDDATFFRRINLALAGRIPDIAEVRAFMADPSPDKRARAIDRLLDSPAFVNYMARSWRGWLLDDAAANVDLANGLPDFEGWLRERIRANTPLDRMVKELVTYPLDERQLASRSPGETVASPLAFYTAHEGKPENLAAATSRIFLGVRLECAQCHDHPFAKWKRDQFWGLAAFYAGVERQNGVLREARGRREMLIPNSDRAAPATFLDDREPEWQYKKSPRATLAAWLTSAENPFFARAMANRLWWFLFGVGIVDAVDDFHDENPPSHPELLDDLARAFAASGFDTKFLLRAICLSGTFGRSSNSADSKNVHTRLFAHFPMQALSADQLFESLAVVTGTPLQKPLKQDNPAQDSFRRQFQDTFSTSGQPTVAPTTIIQALTLMNGELVNSAATAGKTLDAVLKRGGQTPVEKVETMYLVVLGRRPQAHELERALHHVQTGGSAVTASRHGDILWALLNSLEFRTNH